MFRQDRFDAAIAAMPPRLAYRMWVEGLRPCIGTHMDDFAHTVLGLAKTHSSETNSPREPIMKCVAECFGLSIEDIQALIESNDLHEDDGKRRISVICCAAKIREKKLALLVDNRAALQQIRENIEQRELVPA